VLCKYIKERCKCDRGSFSNIFCWFLCAVNRDEDFVRELFSAKFILHSSWYIRLSSTFLWTFFFNVVFCVCSLFFSQPDVVNITWMTGHIHRSIVDKIDPTSKDVKRVKKYLINYIGLHIFVKCDQKNLFTVPSIDQWKYLWWLTVTRTPLFSFITGRMAYDNICGAKLFTRSVCCFGFRFGNRFELKFFFLSLS